MKKNQLLSFVTITLLSFTVFAQTREEMLESQKLEREAISAYRGKDFPAFLQKQKRASELRPNHPRLIYNLAIAYSLNGENQSAMKELSRMADMGLYFRIAGDEDFNKLKEQKEFKELVQKFESNKSPINKSIKQFSLDEKDLITESVAYDPVSKNFFISSIHKGKIIVRRNDGTIKDFSSETDGLWSVSGMKVDPKRRVLWVVSTAFPQMKGFKKEDDGKSGIFKYDLRSGKLIKKYLLSNDTEKHALGDLAINKAGDVFATDSIAPVIYRISVKSDTLEPYLRDSSFNSLQGIVFSADEKTMYVADYSKGIFKIDIASKKITQLKPANNITLIGIDGLYFYRGSLIAIQNGTNPQRVIKFTATNNSISRSETIEANHPDFNEPTLGVIVGNDLYYIANSQWPLVNEKAELDKAKLHEPVILKLRLK